MNQERLSLKWHTYNDHLREMLHDIMISNELTDVTLVSENKKQFKVHKVILYACSPVLKSIINECSSTNPLIYLRGIQSYEIESILQFMYLGEATCLKDRVSEFLDVANLLEIKEISKDSENPNTAQFPEQLNESADINSEHIPKNIGTKQSQTNSNQSDQLQKKEKQKVKIEHPDESSDMVPKQRTKDFDTKQFKARSIQNITTSKSKGGKHPCSKCDYKAKKRSQLKQHIKSIHEGIKYPCDQCNKNFSFPGDLRKHEKSIKHNLNVNQL